MLTGCAGFIGSHLCERLLAEGHHVIGIDNFDPFYPRPLKEKNLDHFRHHPSFEFREGDISEPSFWDELDTKADLVIHLAAKAGVLPSLQDPMGYVKTNIGGTQLLLEWMKKHRVKKLVFGSSSSVYGNTHQTPFHEDMDVSHPISNYAFTKVAGEVLIKTYHHLHGIDAAMLRFFTVIGPRQRPDLAINKFVRLIKNDEPVTMYGDGSTARDYTYVGDIVEGIILALMWINSHSGVCEIFNLGNSTPVALKQLISMIYSKLEVNENIIQVPMQDGDMEVTNADIRKAMKEFGYKPKTSLQSALSEYLILQNT